MKYEFENADNIFYQIAVDDDRAAKVGGKIYKEKGEEVERGGQIVHFENFAECRYMANAIRLAACILAAMDSQLIEYDEYSYVGIKNALFAPEGNGVVRLFKLPPMKLKWKGIKTELGMFLYLSFKAVFITYNEVKHKYVIVEQEKIEDARKKNRANSRNYREEIKSHKQKMDEALKAEESEEYKEAVKRLEEIGKHFKGCLFKRDDVRLGDFRKGFEEVFGVEKISNIARKTLSAGEGISQKRLERLHEIQQKAKEYELMYDYIQKAYYNIYEGILKNRNDIEKLYNIVNETEGL